MGFEIHEALKEFLAFLEKQDGDNNTTITKKTEKFRKIYRATHRKCKEKITEQDYENLMKVRGEIREVADQIEDNGTVLIFPTVPSVAPLREGRSRKKYNRAE